LFDLLFIILLIQSSYSIALRKTDNKIKQENPSQTNDQFFGYGVIQGLQGDQTMYPCSDASFNVTGLDGPLNDAFQQLINLASNVYSNSLPVLTTNVCANIQPVMNYFDQQFFNQTGTTSQDIVNIFGPLTQSILQFHRTFLLLLGSPGFTQIGNELQCIAHMPNANPAVVGAINNFFGVLKVMMGLVNAGKMGGVDAICATGLLCSMAQFRVALNYLLQANSAVGPNAFALFGNFFGGMVLTIANIPNIIQLS